MSTFRYALPAFCRRVCLALVLLGAGSVHATIYTVGTGGGCTHTTLQAAVAAAEVSPPTADLIRVTTEVYSQQQVTIFSPQELDIVGGHAACNAAAPTPNSRATLDGNGGSALPVLHIVVPTGGVVRLRNFVIRRGDRAGEGEGGGIYFEGNGLLEVHDTNIANNLAGYGGGLYARGTGDDATVEFGANVTVVGNTARRSGGGVYIDQVKFHMTQAGSGLYLNEALGDGGGGFGGGLILLAKARDAYAFIGSGMGNAGVIFNNKAKYGGGVALTGEDGNNTDAQLNVFSGVAGQPAGIRDNVASVQGGALYMQGRGPLFSGSVSPDARLWNTVLEGNTAPDGAAIYSDIDGDFASSSVYFNSDQLNVYAPDDFVCPPGQFCGGIVDNLAQTPDGTATDGAVIHTLHGFSLSINEHDGSQVARGGVVIEGNRGGRLIHSGDGSYLRMENFLIADNQVINPLIHVGNDSFVRLVDVTLAGNLIASGNPVFQYGDGDLTLRRAILWQPGRTVLQCSGCDKTFERVMANERDSLDGGSGTEVVVSAPRFVDPSNGDYRLRAASPAVDYVPAIGGDDRDVLGLARDVKLPIKLGAPGGIRDIGAFERQTLQPLVLNSDLDRDIRLWDILIADAVSFNTLNVNGAAGSGSLRVSSPDDVVAGQANRYARQCIHLPGPARYALNGWGRSGSPGGFPPPLLDLTQLRWELRHNGGEDCTSGTIAASGALHLSSGDWRRPANPAVIDVPAADWTIQSSLVVYLVVVQSDDPNRNAAVGWFDGITLEVAAPEGVVFRDGFE